MSLEPIGEGVKSELIDPLPRLSDRYLAAYANLEKSLWRLSGESKRDSFAAHLDRAAKKNPTVRRFKIDLQELADLRNAIVHERSDGRIIAEPHGSTVEEIERIEKTISDPPKAESFTRTGVHTCRPDQRIGEAARAMFRGSYSQLPVLSEGRIGDLLTTDAIARWIAARFTPELNLMEEEDVDRILAFSEDRDAFRIVARTVELAHVLEMFERGCDGAALKAVLVTQSGKRTDQPLGIITPSDMPGIYSRLT